MADMTDRERKAVCPECGCVAFKKTEHASRCPRGSDPTGAKLDRMMGRAETWGEKMERQKNLSRVPEKGSATPKRTLRRQRAKE